MVNLRPNFVKHWVPAQLCSEIFGEKPPLLKRVQRFRFCSEPSWPCWVFRKGANIGPTRLALDLKSWLRHVHWYRCSSTFELCKADPVRASYLASRPSPGLPKGEAARRVGAIVSGNIHRLAFCTCPFRARWCGGPLLRRIARRTNAPGHMNQALLGNRRALGNRLAGTESRGVIVAVANPSDPLRDPLSASRIQPCGMRVKSLGVARSKSVPRPLTWLSPRLRGRDERKPNRVCPADHGSTCGTQSRSAATCCT